MRHFLLLSVVVLLSGCFPKKESTLTVAELSVPSDSLTSVPHLVTDEHGNVLLSWVEKRDTSRFWFSRLQPSGWSDPTLIARGSNWFINWADYPMISSDGGKNMIAHMLDRSGKGTYSYDVKVFTSTDSGFTWRDPFVLHDDGKLAEHGFVSLVPFGEKIFVTWLDGRNASMEGMEGMDHSGGHHGSMTLRAAILDYSGNKSGEWELDPKTCDCCQTAAAVTPQGPVVIYRDRTDEEVRDMSIIRLVNGAWTPPISIHRDNWKIAGCPVNGPRVAVRGNSLAVAWFSAVTQPGIVNLILSDDGGESFGEAIRVDEGNPIGRVDIEWIDDDRCVISWMEGALIKAAIVHADGRKEASTTIAESSEARSSGFPQMTRSDERLIFAWTDVDQKRIRSATVTLN